MDTNKEAIVMKQIEEAKAELFKLCDDFNGEDDASCRISMLSDVAAGCFDPDDENSTVRNVNYVVNTYYRINQIAVFMAALSENLEKIETFEHRLKKPEFACY